MMYGGQSKPPSDSYSVMAKVVEEEEEDEARSLVGKVTSTLLMTLPPRPSPLRSAADTSFIFTYAGSSSSPVSFLERESPAIVIV